MRFFRSKVFLLLLVTILLVVVIAFSADRDGKINLFGNSINVPFTPIQKALTFIGTKVHSVGEFFRDTKAISRENEELKEKIAQMEKDLSDIEQYKAENKEFKTILNMKDQFSGFEFQGANVIAKDMGNWFNSFTIDIGSSDGVKNNSPVITSMGLVGRVTSTNPFSSKVINVIDQDFSVSAIVTKTRDAVVVKGDLNLKKQGFCRMDYFSAELDLAVGDTIETAGIDGGYFPKGIIIGKVKEVRGTDTGLNRYAVIEPVVDFKRLEYVTVLKPVLPEKNAVNSGLK